MLIDPSAHMTFLFESNITDKTETFIYRVLDNLGESKYLGSRVTKNISLTGVTGTD